MSGDAIDAGSVTGEVAETVAPGSSETHSHSSDSPTNSDILAKLDHLESLLMSTVTGATSTATEPSGDVAEPDNGEVIRDKSPASVPWTHKKVIR